MRYSHTTFKDLVFNFKYIQQTFGVRTGDCLRQWIDANYGIVRALEKLRFLQTCKNHDIFPSHLKNFCKIKFNLYHYKSIKKLEGLLCRFRTAAINIEIFDLH